MLKSVQTVFNDQSVIPVHSSKQNVTTTIAKQPKAKVGHYLNYHTKLNLKKKRKFSEEEETENNIITHHNQCTLTYNLLYIPRILKNDLRRQYPVMFMNVFNSCDYQYMMRFIDKFLSNDAQFVIEAPARYVPLRAVATGRENCGQAWFSRMNDAPDQYFELTSSQIRVRSDGSCRSCANFKYQGTAIIYVDPKKVEKTLSKCTYNDSGILTLPSLPTPPQLLPLNKNLNLCCVNNSLTSDAVSSYLNQLSELDFSADLINQLKGEGHHYEIMAAKDHDQSHQNSYFGNSLALNYSVPLEENEYLYNLFDSSMNLVRKQPRIPSPTETMPLGFPFHFIGDLTFYLDEESRIVKNEMKSYLLSQALDDSASKSHPLQLLHSEQN